MTDPTVEGMRKRAARMGAQVPLPGRPEQPPQGPAPKDQNMRIPIWVFIGLSVAGIVAQNILVALHALPPSGGVTVALIVCTAIGATLAGVEGLLSQYHTNKMEQIRAERASR